MAAAEATFTVALACAVVGGVATLGVVLEVRGVVGRVAVGAALSVVLEF